MKSYEELKKELQGKRKNIKGFNREFYKIFVDDRKTAEQIYKNGLSVSDFWKNSKTSKTWFYKNNGGAYCELLSLCY